MNYTCDGLLGQPTAIIPPGTQPIATAIILFATTPTPLLAVPPIPLAIPTAVLLVVPIAVPLVTPTAAPAAPAGTSTPLSPSFTQYLYPSTTRDRLNYTFNGLAIGPESV